MDEREMAVEETVDIFDEQAQKSFDAEVIVNGMKQIRQALGVAKVNKELAQAGLLSPDQKMHPQQFVEEIRRHREGLTILKRMWGSLGSEGLLETTLEVYGAVPQKPLTDTVQIT